MAWKYTLMTLLCSGTFKHQSWFSFFSTSVVSWWVISLWSLRGSAISAQYTIFIIFFSLPQNFIIFFFFSATKCGTSIPPGGGLSFKPLNELSGKKIYGDPYQTPLFNDKPLTNLISINFSVQRQPTVTQTAIFPFVSEDFKLFMSATS